MQGAAAQDFYRWHSTNYPTLEAAEAAMRAYNAGRGGDGLYQCYVDELSTPGATNYSYCVDRQAATLTGEGGYVTGWYGFSCTPNTTPVPGQVLEGNCIGSTEAYVVSKFEEWLTTSSPWAGQCDLQSEVVGEYESPFSTWSDPGLSSTGNDYVVRSHDHAADIRRIVFRWRAKDSNGQCSSSFSENSTAIRKEYVFSCPAGYRALTMSSSGGKASWPFICRATATDLAISKTGRASNTCDTIRTDHPCVPATGEKLLFESDFVWAGHAFGRTYRSKAQSHALAQMGFNWSHTWSSNVTLPLSSGQPVMFSNQNNNREEYRQVSGVVSTYRATSDRNKLLRGMPDGSWIQYGDSGIDKIFTASGRLEKINDSRNPAQTLTFSYDDKGRMTNATDGIGRSLSFEYEENIYINPANGQPLIIPGSNAIATYGGGGSGIGDSSVAVVPGRTHLPTAYRLTAVKDASGSALASYSYDAAGRLVSVMYPDGKHRDYHYGETGHVCVGATSGCNNTHFAYYLTGVTSEDGTRLSNYYFDGHGHVVESVHAGGAYDTTLDYQLDTVSQTRTAVTQSGLGTTTYTFEPPGSTIPFRRPLTAVSSDGTETWQYDYYGLWKNYTDKRGITSRTEYNAAGRQTALIEAWGYPEQRSTVTEWSTDFVRKTAVEVRNASDQALRRVEYTYNGRDQVVTTVLKDVATTASRSVGNTYCEQSGVDAGSCPLLGLLTAIDGPRTDIADTSTFTYYPLNHASCASDPAGCPYRKGNLWKVTNALGQFVEFLKYDIRGNPLSFKDANGVVTDYQYDARGRLTASFLRGANDAVESDDRIVRFEYWPGGEIKKITLPDGSHTTYSYDAAHRLTGIADASGNTIAYTLDAAGHRLGEEVHDTSSSLVRTLTSTYNTVGRLQSVTDAYNHSASLTYDGNGNPDLSSDALGRVEDSDYDALDRVVRSLADVGGISAETKMTYNLFGEVTKVTDPKSLNTQYTYNGFGDLTQLDSPDTGVTSYTYDSAGNRASQTDARSKVANYTYDALNRLTGISYPTASTLDTTYTWDTAQADCLTGETFTAGRLAKIVDGSGDTVYCYDRFGQIVRKVQTTNSVAFTLRYTWNAAGQLTSTIYPDGAVVDYVYDTQGRVSEIGAKTSTGTRQVLLTNVSYHPFGPASSWRYGSSTGRLLNRTRNQNYQPGVVQDTTTGGLSVGYEFDEVGNLKKLRDGNQSEPPQRIFGYDGLNRLTQTQDGSTSAVLEGYTYDKTGNRTSATVSGTTTTYTYPSTSHRLDQVGSSTRAYDFNGNTTSVPTGAITKNYVYGDHNRMTQYLEGTTVKMNYVYNGRGEQVQKSLGTANTYTMYDEAGHWIGDYGNSGATAPTQQAIWFGDLPVGLFTGAGASQKVFYIQPDALGTPRVVIDPARGANGTTVWKWDLAGEAFGTTAPNQDPDGDATQFVFDLRFPGQRYDSASELNYNYFRDYEAATGRYVESDPIGLRGGRGTYIYGSGRSLVNIDPAGLRDVIVAVWQSEWYPFSVGHVFVGEMNGTMILSQFPTPHGLSGVNTPLSWVETLSKEGRDPTDVYKINIRDDFNFDRVADAEKSKPTWHWLSYDAKEQTQCTVAADNALRAGGIDMGSRRAARIPDFMYNWLQSMSSGYFPDSGVSRLPGVPDSAPGNLWLNYSQISSGASSSSFSPPNPFLPDPYK